MSDSHDDIRVFGGLDVSPMADHGAVEFGDRMDDLWHDLAVWSQRTFGTDKERGPVGPLKHLRKEADEALEAAVELSGPWPIREDSLEEELADCLMLVLDAARRSGVGLWDLVDAARRKLAVNKTRTYPKPVGDEPSEHVRDAGAGTTTNGGAT